MRFDDQGVAEWFGLELARLCVDSRYRELDMERHETNDDAGTINTPAQDHKSNSRVDQFNPTNSL